MPAREQSVGFGDPAFDDARALVDAGEYPTISAAVSGELVRAKIGREREAELFATEVERRSALPPDQRAPLGDLGEVTRGARERPAKLRRGESA